MLTLVDHIYTYFIVSVKLSGLPFNLTILFSVVFGDDETFFVFV